MDHNGQRSLALTSRTSKPIVQMQQSLAKKGVSAYIALRAAAVYAYYANLTARRWYIDIPVGINNKAE